MTRTRICSTCGESFTYPIGSGTDRKHCSDGCRLIYQLNQRAIRKANAAPCATEGCKNKCAYSEGICNTCYYRRKRTGTTAISSFVPKYRYVDGSGYISLKRSGHLLADAEGRVREHRIVLFDAIGPGSHPCHWCERLIGWDAASKYARLVVDHLNENKQDNRPENLVPSCNDCNRARGAVLPFLEGLSPESFAAFVHAAAEYRASLCNAKDAEGSAA